MSSRTPIRFSTRGSDCWWVPKARRSWSGDDDQCWRQELLVTMGDRHRASRSRRSLPGEQVMSSYGSGDLRPSPVTERFAMQRRGRLICLRMRSGRLLKCTPEHTHFAGYLLGETPQTYFLYLMHKEGVGYRLGTSQVYTARPAQADGRIQAARVTGARGLRVDHPRASRARAKLDSDEMTHVAALRPADTAVRAAQGQYAQRPGARPRLHRPSVPRARHHRCGSCGCWKRCRTGRRSGRTTGSRSRNSSRRNIVITLVR